MAINYDGIELSDDDIRLMQIKSWEMYKYIREFCDEHGLLFYACGGSCIGAVRERGFIKWDDDIDLFMPREDYNKLRVLWPKYADKRYRLVYSKPGTITGDLMLKICDTETTLITTYQQNVKMPQGLTLDILPLDGCPKPGSFARRIQMLQALFFSLFYSSAVPRNHGSIIAFGANVLLTLVGNERARLHLSRHFEKQMSKYPFKECEYVTELCAGPKYMRNEYRREWFDSATELPFEDDVLRVPVGYHEYLTMAFGDYMTPPESNQQRPHHGHVVFEPQKPYEQYLEELTPEQKRSKELRMLVLRRVIEFCQERDIPVFLSRATLLGAVIQKGFLPWDTELQLQMLREDYDRFIRLFAEEDQSLFSIRAPELDNTCPYTVAKVSVSDTEVVKVGEPAGPDNPGIAVDIFPLDKVPENPVARFWYFIQVAVWRQLFLSSLRWKAGNQHLKLYASVASVIRSILHLILTPVKAGWVFDRFQRVRVKYQNSDSNIVGYYSATGAVHYPKKLLFPVAEMKFAGATCPVPAEWDKVLSAEYGDFMELPSRSQRLRRRIMSIAFGRWRKDNPGSKRK